MNKSEDIDIRLNKPNVLGGEGVNTNPAAMNLTPDTINTIREALAEGIARTLALAIIDSTNQAGTYEIG